ncbi:MAG: cytochrome c oxidase subunit II [Deltaproteobacteria bacterium]|nr:cytochrome c oxidase subunit II [Deltaproteobacteria bacterium]
MVSEVSASTAKVDSAFIYIVGVAVCLLVLITFFMIFFVIRYGSKRSPKSENIEGNLWLEIAWTVIPTFIVLSMFYVGWTNFSYIRNAPKDAMTVKVLGRNWSWDFEYKNGRHSDVLRAPLGKPVELILTSADVVHSLYIPAFRIKEDAVPGMKTHMWFSAGEPGTYDIYCTEYCGTGHSHMRSKVIVMEEGEFNAWYSSGGPEVSGAKALKLLRDKGCVGCHSLDGTANIGPTFKGIWGRKTTALTNGREREIIVDGAYIRTSVRQPKADIVKGYPPIMPALPMTDEELEAIISALKDLK